MRKLFSSKIFFLLIYFGIISSFFTLQTFNDEYEHAATGWLMLNGYTPYLDFFSHHAPLPLFLGILGFVVPSIDPMLVLRGWTIFFQLLVWWLLLKNTKKDFHPTVFLTMILAALATPIFHFQMALANVFFNFGLLSVIILLFHRYKYQSPSPTFIIKWFGVISILCLWSSIATALPIVILGFLLLLLLIKQQALPDTKKLAIYLGWTFLAFISLPFYYLSKGELSTFIWSTFTYNTHYYFPLRLAQGELELKYGAIFRIVHQFWLMVIEESKVFFIALVTLFRSIWGGKQLLFSDQLVSYLQLVLVEFWHQIDNIRTLLTLMLVVAVTVFAFNKKYLMSLLTVLIAFSLFFRSNEVFHLASLSLFLAFVLSWQFIDSLKHKKKWLTGLISLTFIYYLGLTLPVFIEVQINKPDYVLPVHKSVAFYLKENSSMDDKMMVLHPNMIYYPISQRLPSCRYHYYLPWLDQTEKIRNGVLECLQSEETKFVIIPEKKLPELESLWPTIEENYSLTDNEDVYVKK